MMVRAFPEHRVPAFEHWIGIRKQERLHAHQVYE
jgi:hypothetical protein